MTLVDSTNDSLREQVQAFAKTGHVLPEGYSLRAEYQIAGKGRLGRDWIANPGENLLVSYLMSSAGLQPDRLFSLSQNLALAVRDTVEELTGSAGVSVKWPNDIYIEEQKVAGILIETVLMGDTVSYVIVGIGLNVNQIEFGTEPRAISLALVGKKSVDLGFVWQTLTRKLLSAHNILKDAVRIGDLYPLQQRYHSYLFGLGQWIVFEDLMNGGEVIGKVIGVKSTGELRLERDGKEEKFKVGELKFVRKSSVE